MKLKNPFKDLTKFELSLWLVSIAVVTLSFVLPEEKNYLNLCASLIGVTALIFVSKGYVLGQALIVVFAVFYGIISFHFRYYGEVITYLGMSAPMAVLSMVSWIKHPYKSSREVEVNQMNKRQTAIMAVSAVAVTVAFYFILDYFNTANIVFSTVSVTTSFVAAYMTYMRSPYYAIGYALNDVVLIVLWVLAAIDNISYIPMIFCFVMFLFNDLYGFINWQRIKKRQQSI